MTGCCGPPAICTKLTVLHVTWCYIFLPLPAAEARPTGRRQVGQGTGVVAPWAPNRRGPRQTNTGLHIVSLGCRVPSCFSARVLGRGTRESESAGGATWIESLATIAASTWVPVSNRTRSEAPLRIYSAPRGQVEHLPEITLPDTKVDPERPLRAAVRMRSPIPGFAALQATPSHTQLPVPKRPPIMNKHRSPGVVRAQIHLVVEDRAPGVVSWVAAVLPAALLPPLPCPSGTLYTCPLPPIRMLC